jgi:hypothetical protein
VGKRVGAPLALGNHGPYNRQIHHFKHPGGVRGDDLKTKLFEKQVLAAANSQKSALNIVRTWDPYVTSILVLFPVVLSLVISIVWSVMGSMWFKGDVHATTQTGFTIGSYVVTAGMSRTQRSTPELLTNTGALIIALVAFLDTKVNTIDVDLRGKGHGYTGEDCR